MALGTVQAPWYYRQRQLMIGLAYGCGFFFGYLIDGFTAPFWNQMVPNSNHAAAVVGAAPTYVLVGSIIPWLGVRGGLGVVLILVLVAWLWRVWGASYLSDTVIWSEDVRTGTLQVAGPYRFTRNPLYFGNLILALGMGMLAPPEGTILVVALNWLMVGLMIRVEEPPLLRAYGDAYRAYLQRVPRLFPVFFRSAPATPAHPSLVAGLRSEIMIGAFVLAVLVGYLTQRPLSWPVLAVFVAGFIVHEIVNRRAPESDGT
jgi:protein-S-isoprenylcysteine O-methyltransferase Ste14